MTQTVGEIDFPIHGFLQTRRGPVVEVALSNDPAGAARTYVLVPDGAGELPAGIYSTLLKHVIEDDEEHGWWFETHLERERKNAPVRADATLGDEDLFDEHDLHIASSRDTFEPDEGQPEREGDQPVNPYGLWALDADGNALLVDAEFDDESNGLIVEAMTRYGKSLHPWVYGAVRSDDLPIDDDAFEADDALLELQLHDFDGVDDLSYQRWHIGTRRAIEAAAPHPLPDFDPGQWMRWLTPVDGADPVAFGGFYFPKDRVIELQPVMPVEPEWAAGRVLTIPMPRPGVEYEERREVTVYAKPFKELRSSVSKIVKRPPTPVGRFVLEAEGYMPEGWSRLG